jgi:hypothetical protein
MTHTKPNPARAARGSAEVLLKQQNDAEHNRPTTETQAAIISAIKAHIAKGDKAAEKAEQHYIAAGQHLATLKKEHAGTWAEWEALLKTISISTGRASELMQIADGRKTVEQVRADTNRRKIGHRKIPSFRNEENEPIEITNEAKIDALLRRAERARLCARFDGVPNEEAIEAVRRAAEAWSELLARMAPPPAKTRDGRCRWVKDDGGRSKSGIPRADQEVGDCVARAQRPYREVHDALVVRSVEHAHVDNSTYGKWQRRRGGVRAFDADHGCSDGAYGPYLESLGWKFTSTKDQRIRLRADELPPGRLIVKVHQHLVAVIDGVIHDTHDSGGAGRRPVYGYYASAKATDKIIVLETTTGISALKTEKLLEAKSKLPAGNDPGPIPECLRRDRVSS